MRTEAILDVHMPTSYVGVPSAELAKIIQDAFTKEGSEYTSVHVHTSDGPLIFKKNEGVQIDSDYVSRKADDASFYRNHNHDRKAARSAQRSW